MKRTLFIIVFITLLPVVLSAQYATGKTDGGTYKTESENKDWVHSGLYISAGAGLSDNASGSFDAHIGYRSALSNHWSWDIINLGYYSQNFPDSHSNSLRATTAIRYTSSPIESLFNRHAYVTLGGGTQFNDKINTNKWSIAADLGFGLELSRHFSIGILGQWGSVGNCDYYYWDTGREYGFNVNLQLSWQF